MRTNILCKKAERRHTVTIDKDGTAVSTGADGGCGPLDSEAARIAGLMKMGGAPATDSCAGLIALQRYGIPSFLSGRPNDDGYMNLGSWKDLYVRFGSNKVIESTMSSVRRKRDAAHLDTFKAAHKALSSCKSYGRKFRGDDAEVVQFMPEEAMVDGRLIATQTEAIWTVPLQKEWLQRVHGAGLSVVSHRFVCGIEQTHSGGTCDRWVAWAVADGDEDDRRIVVRKYLLVGTDVPDVRKLEKLS